VELTEIQKKAVELTGGNVVVSAGAGTGKTAVLVARFINLVRSGLAEVNRILTITFTEKAAQEMKQRIAEGFAGRGMRKEKTAVETSFISTIHSFCSRLIRENPFAAGVDPEFEILDEIDRQLILGELFDELFSEGEDDFLGLAEHYGEAAVSKAIIAYMDLCRSLGREVEHVEKLVAEPEVLTRKAKVLADKRAAEAMREIRGRLDALSSLKASDSWEEKRREILAVRDSISDASSFRETAERMRSITARMPRAPKKSNGRTSCLEVREHLSLIRRVLKERDAEIFFDKEMEEMLLPCKVALLKGTALFWRKYERKKRERGVLDYEDLQLIARGLLRDKRALRRDYAERFRYVLVDEFQDINWLQKELIELVTSGENLFVVGDTRQSIYGFRNADVEILAGLVKKCRSLSSTHGCVYLNENFRSGRNLIHFFDFFFSKLWEKGQREFHPLQYGRKGGEEPAAPSVEVMLFERGQEEGRGLEDADGVRQREARAVAARITKAVRDDEILVYDPALAGNRPVAYGDMAILCRTRASYSAYSEALADIGVPFYTVGGQSFYEKQEVADLVNLLTIIDNPLRDIPLVGVLRSPFVGIGDDTLLWLRRGGKQPASTERATGEESDSATSEGSALRLPEHCVLRALQGAASIPRIAEQEREKLVRFRRLLDGLRRRKDSMPLHRLLKEALESTPYLTRTVTSLGGAQKAANVSKFLDLLREYEARQGGGIGGFLRFYEIMRRHGPREEEAALEPFSGDVVKLMTIHAAKGLEFPVVVVADMSRRFNFDTDRFLVSREMEIACNPWQETSEASCGRKLVFEERKERQLGEEKRLLYVAATRARDHLILAGSYRAGKECDIERARCPMHWLMAILGEETELPERGESCEAHLGEARVRILMDAEGEKTAGASGRSSPMERYFERIAAGESIPVSDAATEKFLPEVKKVLERITSHAAAEPKRLPAEVSVSQLMQFEECPYRFFLRQILEFPDREVMSGLGFCAPGEWFMEEKWPETRAESPVGSTRRTFGTLVHGCLEEVDFREVQQQDIRAITARFFSSSGEASKAEKLIRSFLRSDDGRRLRNAGEVHRELPVKAAVGDVIINGKIDVLYLDENGHWRILDFKTGSEHAENPLLHSGYDFQMRLYAFLVREAMGIRTEKAIIHFLARGTSRLVPTSAKAIEGTEKRIMEIVAAIGRREFQRTSTANCRQCQYLAVCENEVLRVAARGQHHEHNTLSQD